MDDFDALQSSLREKIPLFRVNFTIEDIRLDEADRLTNFRRQLDIIVTYADGHYDDFTVLPIDRLADYLATHPTQLYFATGSPALLVREVSADCVAAALEKYLLCEDGIRRGVLGFKRKLHVPSTDVKLMFNPNHVRRRKPKTED